MTINERIREANARLRANNWGVSIEQIGGLYVRGLFPQSQTPPKTGLPSRELA
jgi:hypothetical protein